ncbi:MAG: S9 family peptidase [Saprospiraceae bacterium]|nr:S9 family peptidase [Saprospiraceae bacterium]
MEMSCKNAQKDIPVSYPDTKMDTVIDQYHGQSVSDPFRWLEDDRSEQTAEWVRLQNQLTFNYLDQIPFRQKLKDRMVLWMNYEKSSTPVKEKNHYYFFKNNGLQNQDVFYRSSQLDSEHELVIDPNTFSKEGTTSISGLSVSKDEKYLAFQVSAGGSDWNKILVLDLATKSLMKDTIHWVKFSSISWDLGGFYYSRYPQPDGSSLSEKNEFHSVWYHKMGTDQSYDQLIYEDRDHPQRNIYANITEDQRFLCLNISESTSGNALMVKDLRNPSSEWIRIVNTLDDDYRIIGNANDQLYVLTNADAARWKLISFNINQPDQKQWKVVIPESSDVLNNVELYHQKLVVSYMRNASSLIRIFDLNGNFLQELQLPEIGTVASFSGKENEALAFFSFSSFKRPNSIYQVDLDSYEVKPHFIPKTMHNPDDYTTEQHWFHSKDGTRVPLFLTYKKGIRKNGQAPTLLYGYGGFNIPLTPSFNPLKMPLLEHGGILAVANIRGGGEFGKDWHLAGTKEKKQNVFDDFMAAADFLVQEKFTSREKLAIEGRSNGGLLVGACITQKPDMCKVAFPGVGVLDMLRYHKFTIGWAWAVDYGTSDAKDEFDYLFKYSPLHNCKESEYPATMITTADHDDRVVPAHSFKFAATLQKAQKGQVPILIRVDISAGHGAGKPTSKRIDEAADLLSFMFYQMNITPDFKEL